MQEKTFILTLKPDDQSQAFFNTQRRLYFPPERNYLEAHLTLFHQLPGEPATLSYLKDFHLNAFELRVTGLISLGAGVAYRIESGILNDMHRQLATHFAPVLIAQDRQKFRPHITIMNKSTPQKAAELLKKLNAGFEPFSIRATGLELWTYMGGPWQHERVFSFFNLT